MPVLGLHQADEHKNDIQSVCAAGTTATQYQGYETHLRQSGGGGQLLGGGKGSNALFLNQVGVSATVQSFAYHVTDVGALSGTLRQPVHSWRFKKKHPRYLSRQFVMIRRQNLTANRFHKKTNLPVFTCQYFVTVGLNSMPILFHVKRNIFRN